MSSPEQRLFDRLSAGATPPPASSSVEEPKGEPEASKPVTFRNLFKHPDTHPVVLNFVLTKAFGGEWRTWEPETIWDEIEETFAQKNQLSELCRQKIRALQAVWSGRAPWEKWQVFEKVAQPFVNNLANFKTMQILPLEHLYGAVDILNTLSKQEFSDEVKLYMAATVLHDDVLFAPPPLDFLQVEIANPHYKCLDCGNEDSALFSDGFCSNCTGRLDAEQGLTLAPKQDLVAKGKGKNTETVLRYDFHPTERLWDRVKDKPASDFTSDDSQESIQVLKLLIARDYVRQRQKQLAEQLTSLKSWLGAP